MTKSVFIYLINLFAMTACAQSNPKTKINPDAVNWTPYYTAINDYVYVDKDMKQQLDAAFVKAEKFTQTGYAIVENSNLQNAVIDSYGKIVVDYTDESISLNTVRDLTLIKKQLEYDKKMPFWKWEWNIMASGITKTQTYRKTEIRVLETNQLLLSKDVPYNGEYFDVRYKDFDENHILMNHNLYEIKNKKFKKVKSDIYLALDKGRFIPSSTDKFSIYTFESKKPILADLVGTDKIEVTYNGQTFVLDSLNQDRYPPDVPKLLQNPKTSEIYTCPEYDKAFPKEIKSATEAQLNFLKDVSLVYSVNNSPYFILGRFNYDHEIWAYDWLYIDQNGNLLDKINVKDFFILDRVGTLVWPDKHIILPNDELAKYNKIDKISYVYDTENLYIISLCDKQNCNKKGIWNTQSDRWEIDPNNNYIYSLDAKNNVYAVQKEKDGPYILFDLKIKQQIGDKSYNYIFSNGRVQVKKENNEFQYFYIDIYTGKEFRDER
ncbi:hypothetical protein HXZ94_07300 [Empedobacter falsenii]|uniref:hypothetical protein n=1 Tax=Empedobacter falsenii TaxID=343874 RepID=UPI002577CA65|nr:hypothetical protein [Empedobacter falsenii]MDM1298306.1 hypothetical protein [Empedobacter falsenii]MDM1318137.1 hypothetical protein [Empedobacter falsenii]